ncbi:MAG: crossover junction endodeoxyribonuclease RuvC, partial [Desulfobacteraceae bacterium]
MAMVKVIGIDPGLAATGVGIVVGRGLTVTGYACGIIRTDKSLVTAARLETLFEGLGRVLADERPDLMVVE